MTFATTSSQRPNMYALTAGVSITLLVTLAASTATAGPWTKAPGQVYVKASESYFGSDTYVSSSGERISGTDYLALTSALYLEAGLTERLHVQAYIPWAFTRNEFSAIDTRYANVGMGDAIVGLQSTPFKLKVPYAIRLDAKIPLYDVAAITGPSANMFPAFGDGQVDLTGWLSVGGSLYPRPLYFLAEVGYRHRTEVYWGEGSETEFADGIAFNAQVGYTFAQRFLLAANLGGIYTFAEDQVTASFVTLGPALGVSIANGFSLEAGASPMIWSRNNSPGATYTLGLSYSR